MLKGVGEVVLWLALQNPVTSYFGIMPEFLEEDMGELWTGIKQLLKDPGNIVEAIGQSTFDTVDEKEAAYSVSYVAADVVSSLLLDKGLGKLGALGKADDVAGDVAKYTDEVAEAASKAGKQADDVAEATKAAAGKVVRESGNYSSLRELMLPEEVARYDEHWLDVAEKISNEALDNQIDFIKNGGITKPGGGAYKPAKISAAVDLNTGDIYFGYNGANKFNPSIQEIHPDLQQRINRTMSLARNSIDNEYASRMSFEKWSVDNCAEIYSVNNALQNQATLDNIFINTKYFKDGKYALPCRNCQVTFEGCLFSKQ